MPVMIFVYPQLCWACFWAVIMKQNLRDNKFKKINCKNLLQWLFARDCSVSQKRLLLLFSSQLVSDSLRPHGLQHTRLPCPPLSGSFLKFMSIESGILSKHLILRCPLLLLPSVFPSIRIFSNESALHIRWSRQK